MIILNGLIAKKIFKNFNQKNFSSRISKKTTDSSVIDSEIQPKSVWIIDFEIRHADVYVSVRVRVCACV